MSPNVIEASWQALVDSFEYKLYKDAKRERAAAEAPARRAAEREARRSRAGRGAPMESARAIRVSR